MNLSKLIVAFFAIPLFLISCVFPKSKNRISCGGWFGQNYSDSSRKLFEFLSESSSSYEVAWITRNTDVVKLIEKAGGKAFIASSFQGILWQLRTAIFIGTVNSRDFYFPVVTPRANYFQCWHGLPMKKIGFDVKMPVFQECIAYLRALTIDRYTAILCPDRKFFEVMAKAFKVPERRILYAPYPRWDGFIKGFQQRATIRKKYNISEDTFWIIVLPTHRDEGYDSKFIHLLLRQLLDHNYQFSQRKIKLLIKPHYYDFKNIDIYHSLSNVTIKRDIDMDIYELLGAADLLITDYSSVAIDYQLVGGKTLCITGDQCEYISKGRGMYFTPEELGFHTYETVAELVNDIDNLKAQQGSGIYSIVDDTQFYTKECWNSWKSFKGVR